MWVDACAVPNMSTYLDGRSRDDRFTSLTRDAVTTATGGPFSPAPAKAIPLPSATASGLPDAVGEEGLRRAQGVITPPSLPTLATTPSAA